MKLGLILIISFFALTEDWDAKFIDVCSRDKFCSRLKSGDGTWLRPKSEIIALLKNAEVQNEIKTASAKYGVDPTAVAGAIVAENSLNVGVKDSVQTWLASKMGITNIAGKNFSFGLGQIQLPAAREAEDYLAKIENRTPKTDSELTQEIADPMGSIRIAATIVRKVQDDYKAQGFDISKEPGLLTTLYNLGQSSRRAQEAKDAGRLPQVNYFGLFVDKYTSDIRASAKINQNSQTANKVAVAAKPISPLEPNTLVPQNPPTSTAKIDSARAKKNLIKTEIVTKPLALLSAPLLCEGTTYGQDIANETKTTGFGAPVGVLEKDEAFTEISRTLDCKSNSWTLVKSKDSKVGWVQDEQLEKVRSTRLDSKTDCSPNKEVIACKANLEKTIGSLKIEAKGTENLIYLQPITGEKQPDQKISFKKEDFYCNNKTPETKNQKTNANQYTNMFANRRPDDEATKEIKTSTENFISFLDSQLLKMSKNLKIPLEQLTEPENPYSSIAVKMELYKYQSKKCLQSLSSETTSCTNPNSYSKQSLEKISKFEYNESPNLNEISEQQLQLEQIHDSNLNGAQYYRFSNYFPSDEEIATTSPKEIKESIADCRERIHEMMGKLQPSQQAQPSQPIQLTAGSILRQPNGGYTTSIGMVFGIGFGQLNPASMTDIFYAAKEGSEEKIKGHSSEFLGFAKFCHARLNLLQEGTLKNKISCSAAPKYLENMGQFFSKGILAKTYQQNPELLRNDISFASGNFVSAETIQDVLGKPIPQQPLPMFNDPNPGTAYCPNKTADFIEDLIKSNPCIKHVYVPTRYLSNKLQSLDSKVIYKKFEDDGKYAIEIGGGTCQ